MDEYPGNSRQTPKKMPEKSEAPKQEQITTGKSARASSDFTVRHSE